MKILAVLLFTISFAQSAWSSETDYLCKVNGNYSGLEGKGKIKETISLSIKNDDFTSIKIVGSENAQVTMTVLNSGASHEWTSKDGFIGTSELNNSSGNTIDLIHTMKFLKHDGSITDSFAFNQKTKVMSYSKNQYLKADLVYHSTFSGICTKQ
jgi:hypothetical protein